MNTKVCICCGEEKRADLFVRDPRVKSGRANRCKECKNERDRRYYHEHSGRINSRRRKLQEERRGPALELGGLPEGLGGMGELRWLARMNPKTHINDIARTVAERRLERLRCG